MVRVEVYLTEDDRRAALAADVREGLTRVPKAVRSAWIWDARGSELFDAITRLPEYYLTRCERELLAIHAVEVARLVGPATVLELGPGAADKTALVLDALWHERRSRSGRQGRPWRRAARSAARAPVLRYSAIDVSEAALRDALGRIAASRPQLVVSGVVGDFERHLGAVAVDGRALAMLLGSTLGALASDERSGLLGAIAAAIGRDGALLLGVDLVKPVERIVAAYSDSGGLSAQLIANLLPILNRELGARFEPERFASEAAWNPELERMEMGVRALEPHVVPIRGLGLEIAFARGELLRTEISTKFRRVVVDDELRSAGLEVEAWWTGRGEEYALCLARPASQSSSR